MSKINVNPNLANLTAYRPPWQGLDRREFLRLDLNENTQPLPDAVVERLTRYLRDVGVGGYPDDTGVREKIAAYCAVGPDHIMVTNGSDQGIDIVLRAILAAGSPMVVARPEFPIFSHVAGLIGATVVGVPYGENFAFPYEVFNDAITPATRLIVVINPNNPTGTPVSIEYIDNLLNRYPNIPILVDEAYYEYTGQTVAHRVKSHDNLIVLRTFSKAFAMAGLRIGYVIGNRDFIDELRKIRGPFDVNCLAIEAAGAQLDSPAASLAGAADVVNLSKPFIEQVLCDNGIHSFGGEGNFLLLRSSNSENLVAHLRSSKILVRPMHGGVLDGLIRMSIGTLADMRVVADAISAFGQQTDER